MHFYLLLEPVGTISYSLNIVQQECWLEVYVPPGPVAVVPKKHHLLCFFVIKKPLVPISIIKYTHKMIHI